MSRLAGILTAVSVILLSMAFAALNAGNSVTLNLGLFTLHRAPVALVAFGGLFVGMVVMFATGIHTDLKVRRILRERLAEESREEQRWIDRNQQDLFEDQADPKPRELADSGGEAGGLLAAEPLGSEKADSEPAEAEVQEVDVPSPPVDNPSPPRED